MDEFNNNNGFGQIPNQEGQPNLNQFQNQSQQSMYNQNMNQYEPQQPVNNQFQNPDYVQVTEGYTPNYNNYNNNGGNSKKPILIVAIIAALLVALAGVAFAAYKLVPGMILSGKDAYFAMEAKSIQSLMKTLEENIGEDYETMLEKPMKSDVKITAGLDGNIPVESKALIETLLKDTSIELKTQTDYKNEYESVEMDLKVLGEQISLDYQNDNSAIAIALKPLFDKYITVDGNDLTPLWKTLDMEGGPKKIISRKELIEVMKLTKDEEKHLEKASKEYLELAKKNINGKNFTTKKGEILEYKDNEIKCNIVEYEFKSEDLYNIMKATMTKLKDDDKTLEIVFGKVEKLYKLYEEAGYTMGGEELPTIENVKETIEKSLENMEDSYDEEEADEVLMIVRNYYTNGLKVLKREFATIEEEKIEFYSVDNKEDAYYALVADDSTLYIDIVKGKDVDEYNIAITKANKETLALPITVEKKSDNEHIIKGELKVPSNDKVKCTFECNLKEEKETTAMKLDLKLSENTQKIDIILTIDGRTEQNAKIEKIDTTNSWNIAKATRQEIMSNLSSVESNVEALTNRISENLFGGMLPMGMGNSSMMLGSNMLTSGAGIYEDVNPMFSIKENNNSLEGDSFEKDVVEYKWSVDELELEVGQIKSISLYEVYNDGTQKDIIYDTWLGNGSAIKLGGTIEIKGGLVKGLQSGEISVGHNLDSKPGVKMPSSLKIKVK